MRNIYDAYTNSDCLEEAYLFFNYRNAKDKKMKIYAPEIDGWENKTASILVTVQRLLYGEIFWNYIIMLRKIRYEKKYIILD